MSTRARPDGPDIPLVGINSAGRCQYAVGRPFTTIHHRDGSAASLVRATYVYDVAGRLTHEDVDGSGRTFTYDAANQLTAAGAESYSFDDNGNRTMSGYSTGTGNRMTNDGVNTYTYDDAGQRSKKSKGALLETWTHGYNHRGQMAWAEQRASDGGVLQMRLDYVYDVFGNRVAEDRWTSATGTVTTRFGYDGTDVWVDLDGSNALQMRYVRPDGIDALAARIPGSGGTVWYLTDRQGTVLANADASGAVVNRNTYNGFGAPLTQTDAVIAGRYLYTGREWQLDARLYGLRGRYLDPDTGRLTTIDPIGFQSGDRNLYRYVWNAPPQYTDPTGLSGFDPSGWVADQVEAADPTGTVSKVRQTTDRWFGTDARQAATQAAQFSEQMRGRVGGALDPMRAAGQAAAQAQEFSTRMAAAAATGLAGAKAAATTAIPPIGFQAGGGYQFTGAGSGRGSSIGTPKLDRTPEEWLQTALGALKAFGGMVEMAAGLQIMAAGGAVFPENPGAGGLIIVVGSFVFVHGLDVTTSGLEEVWTGKPQPTLTQKYILEPLFQKMGMSPQQAEVAAEVTDILISVVGTFGGSAPTRGPRVVVLGVRAAGGGAAAARGGVVLRAIPHAEKIVIGTRFGPPLLRDIVHRIDTDDKPPPPEPTPPKPAPSKPAPPASPAAPEPPKFGEKPYATPQEQVEGVRQLEGGVKNSLKDRPLLPPNHVLTDLQKRALMENVRGVINNTVDAIKKGQTRAGTNPLATQMSNPRFRFLDQVPEAKQAFLEAIKDLDPAIQKGALDALKAQGVKIP